MSGTNQAQVNIGPTCVSGHNCVFEGLESLGVYYIISHKFISCR